MSGNAKGRPKNSKNLKTLIGQAFTAKISIREGSSNRRVSKIEGVVCVVNRAEGIMGGKTKRLIVTVPPRHLKSIVFSVALPAFFLGRDPTKRIICVSYSNELAIKHAIDFRAVVNSPWYRRAFPKTKISREKDTQTYQAIFKAR